MSTTNATLPCFAGVDAYISTNFGISSAGILSMQYQPRSSSVFAALDLPAPDIPVIIKKSIVFTSLFF